MIYKKKSINALIYSGLKEEFYYGAQSKTKGYY